MGCALLIFAFRIVNGEILTLIGTEVPQYPAFVAPAAILAPAPPAAGPVLAIAAPPVALPIVVSVPPQTVLAPERVEDGDVQLETDFADMEGVEHQVFGGNSSLSEPSEPPRELSTVSHISFCSFKSSGSFAFPYGEYCVWIGCTHLGPQAVCS